MTLLIADDRRDKIILIQSMLTHFGWKAEPLIAMTTEEAMTLIDANNITHAFVDFYIPSENGPAIITHLTAKNPDARIALVSSSDSQKNIDAAKEAGAETSICTSYPSDEVEAAFKTLLEAWSE